MSLTRIAAALLLSTLCVACTRKQESPVEPHADTAAASSKTPAATDAYEFRVGEFVAFALKDGDLKFPNDAKTIGMGHSPEEIASLLSAAGAGTTELSLSIQPLLVRAGDRVLLFDTGVADNMGPGNGRLVASMQQAGIDPASVTDIFISHAHGDHVGGLIDGNGALAFTNATVHMSAPEAQFLQGLDEKTAATFGIGRHAQLVAAIAPKLDAFVPGSDLVPGVVKAVEIRGHTPGHSGYLIGSGDHSLLYIGDMAHHYVVSVQEPEWTIAFDGDAPTAQASRKAVIEQSAATGQRIYAVHFPFPGVGKFTRTGERFVWTPET